MFALDFSKHKFTNVNKKLKGLSKQNFIFSKSDSKKIHKKNKKLPKTPCFCFIVSKTAF